MQKKFKKHRRLYRGKAFKKVFISWLCPFKYGIHLKVLPVLWEVYIQPCLPSGLLVVAADQWARLPFHLWKRRDERREYDKIYFYTILTGGTTIVYQLQYFKNIWKKNSGASLTPVEYSHLMGNWKMKKKKNLTGTEWGVWGPQKQQYVQRE